MKKLTPQATRNFLKKKLNRHKQSNKKKLLPSLKLTWPLKIDGWKMSFLLGWPVFRGELLVLGSVPPDLFMILIFTRFSVGFLVLLFHGRIRVDLARFIFCGARFHNDKPFVSPDLDGSKIFGYFTCHWLVLKPQPIAHLLGI